MTTELRRRSTMVALESDVTSTADTMSTSFDLTDSNDSVTSSLTFVSTARTRPETVADSVAQLAAIVSLSIAVAAGNFLLVATVCRSKQLRSSVGNALIINLGVVDLTTSIFVLPLFAVTVVVRSPPGGQSVCTAIAFVTQTLFVESIVTLAAIGVDRYLNICHPLRYPHLVTVKSMSAVLGVSWLYSLIIASVPLVGFGRYTFHGSDRLLICSVDYSSSTTTSTGLERGYAALVLGTVVAPAVAAIAIVYARIFLTARMQTRRIFDTVIDKSPTSSRTFRARRELPVVTDPATPTQQLDVDRQPEVAHKDTECDSTRSAQSPGEVALPTASVIRVERYQRQTSDESLGVDFREDHPVGDVRPAASKWTTPKEPTRSWSDVSKRRTWKTVTRMRSASVSRAPGDTSNDSDGEGRWLNALARIRKAVRQVRAARTVALIIGGFFVCWTPYTVTTIVTVLTGLEPAYKVNFAANFMAFAGGLVNPVVCIFVNRDFWTSFRILVGLRRRELMRLAARAFAEATAETESADWGLHGCRRRFISIGSATSSTDSSDWIVFRERWNELQTAAERRHSTRSSTLSGSVRPPGTAIGSSDAASHCVSRCHFFKWTCFGGTNHAQPTSLSGSASDGLATVSASSETTCN